MNALQLQGLVEGVGGAAQGAAAGIKNETQLAHEMRLEQMAALRMQRYGGMYGGGGTQNMVPGSTMHALDPDWPVDKPGSPQAFDSLEAVAGRDRTTLQTSQARLGASRMSMQASLGGNVLKTNAAIQAASEKSAQQGGLFPGDPDYIQAVGENVNMARAANKLPPIAWTQSAPTTGFVAGIQRAVGQDPQTITPNPNVTGYADPNNSLPTFPTDPNASLPTSGGLPGQNIPQRVQPTPQPTQPPPPPPASAAGWSVQ